MTGQTHAPGQGGELHLLEEGGQDRGLGIAGDGGLDRDRQGGVAVEGHQPARQPDLVGEVDQGLAALVLLHLAGAGQQGVEVAILVDQQGGGLDADAGGAGHIVGAVAAQGLDVDHLVGRDAELLEHLLGADLDVLHGVEHRHPVADQLHQVLVRGDDDGFPALVAHRAGIGGDQVVGLVAGRLERRHAEGAGGLAHQGELRDQVFGRRRPVGLVLVVEGVAEGLLGMVEDDGEVGGRLGIALHVAQKLPQHVAEAGHGPDRQAVGLAGERRQGVVGAEDVAGPVDQIEAHPGPVLGRRGGGGAGQVEAVGHGGRIGAEYRRVIPRLAAIAAGGAWRRWKI